MKRIWKGFWQLADPKIWIASTVPMLVGGALAYRQVDRFEWRWFIISLIGIYLIEIGKNAVNEFIDYASGVDRYVETDKRTPFSGGKKTIVDGMLTVIETKVIAVMTMLFACIIGLYIVLYREPSILWVGLIGVLFSMFYSLPPFKFSYRGMGEVIVGTTFGPLIVTGIYIVMTNSFNLIAPIIGLPIGALIAYVLWLNQYPDYEADAKGSKNNWVVKLGKKRGVKIYASLFCLAYLLIIIIAIISNHIYWLLGLLSLPLAVRAVKVAREYYDDIPKLIEANAKTVVVYLITGVAMAIAALI